VSAVGKFWLCENNIKDTNNQQSAGEVQRSQLGRDQLPLLLLTIAATPTTLTNPEISARLPLPPSILGL
jgi:hypothetical protein